MSAWLMQVERQGRALVPAFSMLALLVLGLIPWHIPGLTNVTPAYLLIGLYFWTLYQPQRLPYWSTFLIGLAQDLLLGLPPGQGALALLLVQGLIASQRRFLLSKPFLVVWWGFGVIGPIAALIGWGVASIARQAFIPVLPVFIQCVMTILLYPLFGGLFGWLQERVVRPVP
ncbi:MAG: rod shape-determining protein MreD [Alphaproteobacteria bacterium]|nr:rod shape-determining protein MreD [Alphaproteobacteria bacterium]